MEPTAFRTGGSTEFEPLSSQQSPLREDSALSRVLDTEMRGNVIMELIVDKLKLLNYERQFCNSRSPWPRLHKFYFALPSANRNEQFLYFSSMAAWLFTLLSCQFALPSEADDPNLTCSKIMMELMALGFAPPNWPPARLKQGYGDAVCTVLDTLCSLVLDAIKYKFTPFTHPYQDDPLPAASSEAENENSELYQDTEKTDAIPRIQIDSQTCVETPTNHSILTNKWKLDLERIAPHLRIVMVADSNDWRAHLEQAKKLYDEILVKFITGKMELKRFEDNITTSMEKLKSHENFVNQQFEGLILEYVVIKRRLISIQEKQDQIKEVMQKLASEHGKVLETLEQVKQKMVEKGNQISDLSPLLQMKAAMQKLRLELREMEVQIGVLEHSLVYVNIRQAKGGGIDEVKG